MTEKVAHELAQLIAEFWDWRIRTQPDSYDDVPRVERPADWVADWSPDAIADRRRRLGEFAGRHRAIDLTGAPLAIQIDGRLLGSALAKVHWELELLRNWQRNACFYLDQALVPLYTLLLAPPPFEEGRAAAILRQLRQVPETLRHARTNLTEQAAAPFAAYAGRLLADGPRSLTQALAALAPLLPAPFAADLPGLAEAAAGHLAAFRDWLGGRTFTGATAVGGEALAFYLHRVALVPYTPEQMRQYARVEFQRAVLTEASWRRRAAGGAAPVADAFYIDRQHILEADVRRFYAERGLLRLPNTLRRYRFAAMPPYVAPLTWLGVPHYLSSQARPDEDALRYVRAPEPGLSYFQQAKILDPRTGIVHEGVHAHQLALSWQHPNPARRYFYDSLPNEGIAFYNEELMLLSGLFDDTPASGVFLANSMRLRALRVDIDLGLSLGEITLDDAAALLAETVPMDRATAREEAALFAATPAQGLSYQIGKRQILDLLATAHSRYDHVDLQEFHYRLWCEGNVPLALQRWELLGLRDHLDQADRLAARSS
ncbi:DUF885 family protein [Nocardia panacis]|uniref:DUF885 family protein n=1 Tax=Nocardia panacis TaxID=2340916 RepID=A0A3A4K3Y4_9NOCA|nr:DUF885 family protein [Nocardia panacis]RJO71453.1 DUF885 family protein [Nocardia panacis]